MRLLIQTTYSGNSKIIAQNSTGRLSHSYEHAFSLNQNHWHAAKALILRCGWQKYDIAGGAWIMGDTIRSGGRIFTYDDGTSETRFNLTEPEPESVNSKLARDLKPGDWIIYINELLDERVVEVNETSDGLIKVSHDFGNGGEPATSFYDPNAIILTK